MRKLFLASFKFATGENEYVEQRIVAVESHIKNDRTEEEWLKEAYDIAMRWFPTEYTESTLIYTIIHPTISGTITDNSTTRGLVTLVEK